ncbi:MAG: hypothetical protein AAF564_05305 [Bacteroidota bacterium]
MSRTFKEPVLGLIIIVISLYPTNTIAQNTKQNQPDSISTEEQILILEKQIKDAQELATQLQESLSLANTKSVRNYELHAFTCIEVNGQNSSECGLQDHWRLEFRTYATEPVNSQGSSNLKHNPYGYPIPPNDKPKFKNKGGWGISIDQYANNSVPDPDPAIEKSFEELAITSIETKLDKLAIYSTNNTIARTELNANGVVAILANYYHDLSFNNFISIGGFLGLGFAGIHAA